MTNEERIVEQAWFIFERWSELKGGTAMDNDYACRINSLFELLKKEDKKRYWRTFKEKTKA